MAIFVSGSTSKQTFTMTSTIWWPRMKTWTSCCIASRCSFYCICSRFHTYVPCGPLLSYARTTFVAAGELPNYTTMSRRWRPSVSALFLFSSCQQTQLSRRTRPSLTLERMSTARSEAAPTKVAHRRTQRRDPADILAPMSWGQQCVLSATATLEYLNRTQMLRISWRPTLWQACVTPHKVPM